MLVRAEHFADAMPCADMGKESPAEWARREGCLGPSPFCYAVSRSALGGSGLLLRWQVGDALEQRVEP